jgi:hypothetical protein
MYEEQLGDTHLMRSLTKVWEQKIFLYHSKIWSKVLDFIFGVLKWNYFEPKGLFHDWMMFQ